MIGLAVGLVTGRRELVAAIVGAGDRAWSSRWPRAPPIGIVAGGVLGPVAGLLVPAAIAAETAPLGSLASADRYSMPGARQRRSRGDPPVDPPPDAPPAGTPTEAPRP